MTGKSAIFSWFARPYVRRRLRKAFSDVRVEGLDALQELLGQGPLLLAPNHVAWWDAFICVALDERLGGGGLGLMDAKTLKKMPFFGWAGAVPLDRRSGRRALRDLEDAAATLSEAGRYLIVFPQGRQRPAHLPLEFRSGIGWLASRTRLPVVPIGLRYDFAEGSRPIVHISIGAALHWQPGRPFVAELEQRVSAQLGRIDVELLRAPEASAAPTSFQSLVAGTRERLPAGTAALSLLAGGKKP